MESNAIKCSYKDCHKYFDSVKAMRSHKNSDKAHGFYCKRCDRDILDDTELLIHQISSPNHICCPICGKEFASHGGRDRHVGLSHKAKQALQCPGCPEVFESASRMMEHIENDKCKLIRQEDFHKQRAERQIDKDAWEAALDPLNGSTTVNTTSDDIGALTLLEDERAHVMRDWEGNPMYNDSDDQHSAMESAETNDIVLGADRFQFPPLGRDTVSAKGHQTSNGPQNGSGICATQELPESNGASRDGPDLAGATPSWSFDRLPRATHNSNVSTNIFNTANTRVSSSAADLKTQATRGDQSQCHKYENNAPATTPSTAAIADTRTSSQFHGANRLELDRLWNPIEQVYVCPGQACGGRYPSIQSFQSHLLSNHANRVVSCPGCFRRFRSTMALVAHCESGSLRCKIRNTLEYDLIIQEITAGLVGIDGRLEDGSAKYTAKPIEEW